MEESSRMDIISHIEETPMILYEETPTNSPPSSFLTSSFHGDLREPSQKEGFWILGRGV